MAFLKLVRPASAQSCTTSTIFLLLGFFSDPGYKSREIVAGQYLGIRALIAISLTAALVALVIPRPYIGLLGLIPIALGIKKMIVFWRRHIAAEDALHSTATHSDFRRIIAVTGVTMANGGDNIGVYTPLFAVRTHSETAMSRPYSWP